MTACILLLGSYTACQHFEGSGTLQRHACLPSGVGALEVNGSGSDPSSASRQRCVLGQAAEPLCLSVLWFPHLSNGSNGDMCLTGLGAPGSPYTTVSALPLLSSLGWN